jgi:hypothetical protein
MLDEEMLPTQLMLTETKLHLQLIQSSRYWPNNDSCEKPSRMKSPSFSWGMMMTMTAVAAAGQPFWNYLVVVDSSFYLL